jgi:L-alanine-DL-glutamate epimerase-like enolase superfamily enzyme
MKSTLRITDVLATPICIPTRPFKSTLGEFNRYEFGIVQVVTEGGLVGLGEIATLWDGAGTVQCAFIDNAFAPRLIGQDAFDINRCLRLMDTVSEAAWPARAAIDMALYDLVGKALDTPVYNLLGGRARESIPLSHSISMGAVVEMAAAASSYVQAGFRCVKVKVGVDEASDVAAVAAVRDAIGRDIALRVDANMGWSSAKQALRMIRRLEPFGLHSVEQPIPPGHVDQMRFIRESVDTPIMVDESVWGPADAWEILSAGAADMINVYPTESGGLTNAALIFRMAETASVSCVIGAMPELGIGTAAAVHLGMAMTNLGDFSDASGVMYQIHDVINEKFRIEDGCIWPLDGPGLGVSLNEDAMERFSLKPRDAQGRKLS